MVPPAGRRPSGKHSPRVTRRAPAPARAARRQLQASVSHLQTVVTGLSERNAALKTRNWVARVAVRHCDALVTLGALLQQQAGAAGAADAGGGGAGATKAGAGGMPAVDAACAQLLLSVRTAHEADVTLPLSRAGPEDPDGQPLGWDPAGAFDALRRGEYDVTSTAGARHLMRSFVRKAAFHCP